MSMGGVPDEEDGDAVVYMVVWRYSESLSVVTIVELKALVFKRVHTPSGRVDI